jgi:hypothetical protein
MTDQERANQQATESTLRYGRMLMQITDQLFSGAITTPDEQPTQSFQPGASDAD